MNLKTNCYKCKNRGSVPGSAHSSCRRPDPSMTGDKHGIRNGWFFYPINFDPVWRTKECDKYEELTIKH
jgi:hypothetical protein